MMFSATVKDGASLKCWCTMPMPARIASAGPPNSTGCAAEQDVAAVARQQAVEDVHQRRLAGAVLADQGMDLPRTDRNRGVMDRDKVAKPLGDMLHADDIDAGHDAHPVRACGKASIAARIPAANRGLLDAIKEAALIEVIPPRNGRGDHAKHGGRGPSIVERSNPADLARRSEGQCLSLFLRRADPAHRARARSRPPRSGEG